MIWLLLWLWQSAPPVVFWLVVGLFLGWSAFMLTLSGILLGGYLSVLLERAREAERKPPSVSLSISTSGDFQVDARVEEDSDSAPETVTDEELKRMWDGDPPSEAAA